YDFSQQQPARGDVITGLAPRHPTRLEGRLADAFNRLLPTQVGRDFIRSTKAACVRQQMPNRNRFLAEGAKLRNKTAHWLVEVQFALLPQLGDSHRRNWFGGREPKHNSIWPHGHARLRLAQRDVSHHLAAQRNIKLRPNMQTRAYALLDDRDCLW